MNITQENLDKLNQAIPQNYLWDGFWIDSFKNNNLNISASFDRIYYRDIMIVYKGVTFFNLPSEWRDGQVELPWMRLGNEEIFKQQFPNEAIENKTIIEWQIFGTSLTQAIESFYIVCDNIFVFKCKDEERDFVMTYKEPIPDEQYLQKRFYNRIPFLKR